MVKFVPETEFKDATAVEMAEAITPAARAVHASTPSRKAKLETGNSQSSDDAAPDYAALGVEEADVGKYEELRLRFQELGRRTTAQVFECGQVVAQLHDLAPDQEVFAKRAKAVFHLSRRGAENYAKVYRNLALYRERLVKVGMIASGLYDLASAKPEQVEEVLGAREAGKELTGAQIKQMVGKESASVVPDDGGVAGLRARIMEKTSTGVASLMDNAATLLEAILVALEPHRQGKRIVVKDTQRPFIHPARLVQQQIEWLTWVAVPAGQSFGEGAIHHQPIVRDDRWADLHAMLVKLGDYEGWPPAGEVGLWLNDTVVPLLSWLLGDRSKKPLAVVEKLATEAEAERKAVEETKQREKAEAKKARGKAKLDKHGAKKPASRDRPATATPAEPSSDATIDAGTDENT